MPLSLGGPTSCYGGYGVKKRIQRIIEVVSLSGKTILDAGCGDGQYIDEFKNYSDSIYGVDIEEERVAKARKMTSIEVFLCDLSQLPFEDDLFDLIFCNEVLEYTDDEIEVLREFHRVLKDDGLLVIYVPNRLFPLETHGGQIFDVKLPKIPFINYLPLVLRNKICKAARCYSAKSIVHVLEISGMETFHLSYVYPSFDKTYKRHPTLARVMRGLTGLLERTPLKIFGISILVFSRKAKS